MPCSAPSHAQGEPPGVAAPRQIACAVGSSAQDTIIWDNPFHEAVSIEVSLVTDEHPGTFRQLPLPRQRAHRDGDAHGTMGGTSSTGGMHAGSTGGAHAGSSAGAHTDGASSSGAAVAAINSSHSIGPEGSSSHLYGTGPSTSDGCGSICTMVPPLASLQLPIGYSPALLRESRAELRVTLAEPVTAAAAASEPLVWRYPILGLAHVDSHGVAVKLRCRARECVEQEATFVLAGLGEVVDPDEVFSAQLVLPDAYRCVGCGT